jgi:hypothetical protein
MSEYQTIDGYISRDTKEAGGAIRLFRQLPKLGADGVYVGRGGSKTNPSRVEPEQPYAVMTAKEYKAEYSFDGDGDGLPGYGERDPFTFEV